MRHVTVLLLSAAVLAFAPAVRAADEPKDIIAKAIKAHGGEEKLAKLQAATSKNKGKLQIPGIGETEFTSTNAVMLPDKLKEEVELTIMGQKITILTLVNGDTITVEANGQAVPVDDNLKKTLANAKHLGKVGRLVTLVKDKGYELSLIGESEVNKAKVIGVKVAMKGHQDINLYFDAKTHILTKMENRTIDPMTGNEVNEERVLQEYEKNADGIPMPKKVAVLRDGKPYMEAEVIEMKYLEKLDEADFKK
jgi:hypothetical protein